MTQNTHTPPASQDNLSLAQVTESLAACLLPFNVTPTAESLAALAQNPGSARERLDKQSQVLDSLFYRLVFKGTHILNTKGDILPRWIDEDALHLALQAQKQCRHTLEIVQTLSRREPGKQTEGHDKCKP